MSTIRTLSILSVAVLALLFTSSHAQPCQGQDCIPRLVYWSSNDCSGEPTSNDVLPQALPPGNCTAVSISPPLSIQCAYSGNVYTTSIYLTSLDCIGPAYEYAWRTETCFKRQGGSLAVIVPPNPLNVTLTPPQSAPGVNFNAPENTPPEPCYSADNCTSPVWYDMFPANEEPICNRSAEFSSVQSFDVDTCYYTSSTFISGPSNSYAFCHGDYIIQTINTDGCSSSLVPLVYIRVPLDTCLSAFGSTPLEYKCTQFADPAPSWYPVAAAPPTPTPASEASPIQLSTAMFVVFALVLATFL